MEVPTVYEQKQGDTDVEKKHRLPIEQGKACEIVYLAKCNWGTSLQRHMIRSVWSMVLYEIRLQSTHALLVHNNRLPSKQTNTSIQLEDFLLEILKA